MSTLAIATPTTTLDVMQRFQEPMQAILSTLHTQAPVTQSFSPAWQLPEQSSIMNSFTAVAQMSISELGEYRNRPLHLLNLMHNPRTRTTKTYASLVIVARAVQHYRVTGEPVVILTPSSANKATALRDAVLRAYESGLATPDQLRIVSVVPEVSRTKLWASPLTEDDCLNQANPLVVVHTERPGDVKALARAAVEAAGDEAYARHGVRLWHTMDVRNYAAADALRAFFEAECLPVDRPRIQAHSVSSAFGLLGYFFGHQVRTQAEWPDLRTGYLLVQHLGTPDMVSHYYHGDFNYRPQWRQEAGLYHQDDPHFPQATYSRDENLDSTFYTHTPATSPRMNELLTRYGGGGIVTSLYECMQRYGQVRNILADADVALPQDPRQLREWSLVMALTGVLNAIDRGIVPTETEMLIHGSGSYGVADYSTPADKACQHVTSEKELLDVVHRAMAV